jgi:uncharacterized membrane protein
MAINILLLGAVIFIGIHLIPAFSSSRDQLVARLSLNGYKLLFTILSLLGLGLMVWGKVKAPHTDVWFPPTWGRDAALVIMLPSMVLLAVAKFPTNIKRVTPHPMLWGFVLWAIAHLLSNGDLSSIILFGSIGIYSTIAILSANQRGARRSTESVPALREAGVLGFGVLVYFGLLYLHPYLFGPKLI